MVETLLGKTLDLIAPGAKTAALRSGKVAIKNFLKTYAKEWVEEPIQAGMAAAATYVLDQISDTLNMTPKDWKEYRVGTKEELIDAAAALPFLMGPGHIFGGIKDAVDYRKGAPALRKILLSSEGAAGWTASHIEQAQKLANKADGKKPPSRQDVGDLRSILTSAQQRADFASLVKQELPKAQQAMAAYQEGKTQLPTVQERRPVDEVEGRRLYEEEMRREGEPEVQPPRPIESEAQRAQAQEEARRISQAREETERAEGRQEPELAKPTPEVVKAPAEPVAERRPNVQGMSYKELMTEAKRLGLAHKGTIRNLRDRVSKAVIGERMRARQFLQNVQNQTGLPQGIMERLSKVDPQTYEQTRTSEVVQSIGKWLGEKPENVTEATNYAMSGESPTAAKGATFVALIEKAQVEENWTQEDELVQEYDKQLRESGRFVQSASLVAGMSGKAFMKHAERFWAEHKANVDNNIVDEIRQEYVSARHVADEQARMEAVGAVVEKIASFAPTTWKDWVGTYRYFNMLSNPQSHERNVHGNLWQTLVARPAALIGRGKVGEAYQYERDALKALPNAFDAFMQAWRSGNVNQKWYEASTGFRNQFEKERMRQGAQQSTVARSLMTVGRFLEAQDKFFAAMIQAGETARLLKKGMDAKEAVRAGENLATELLFRQKVGEDLRDEQKASLVRALDGVGVLLESARKVPFLRWPAMLSFPFVRTPIGIGKKMVEYSPFGYIHHDLKSMTAEDIGRANFGSIVTLAGFALAMAGKTTGRPPEDPEERKLWYDSGRRPWSILIGDKWIPMWYFGIFSGALALPAAVLEVTTKDPKTVNAGYIRKGMEIVGSMASFFTSQTPLSNAGRALDIWTGRIDATAEGSMAFTLGQFVPASGFLRWANQLVLDPVYRRGGSFQEALVKDYPWISKGARPYLTSQGTPAKRPRPSVLLPYAYGTVAPEFEEKRKSRNELLQSRRRNNKELDAQVRLAAKGEMHREDIGLWIRVSNPNNREEQSRLRQRMVGQFRQWADPIQVYKDINSVLSTPLPTYKSGSIAEFRERKRTAESKREEARLVLKELGMTLPQVRQRLRDAKKK
ncbi:MAG: hypothetical protein KKB31_07825 [Nanoarchaeota archaeon]|nr:hypothetical protein [Nanoarchaeota archaeon]